MNYHGRQSYKKQMRLQEVFAGMGPYEELCLLNWSLAVRVTETGRRRQGNGQSLMREGW